MQFNERTSKGLSTQQVNERIAQKKTNFVKKTVGKSYGAIFFTNVFTFFNFLGLFIFVIMASLNSLENTVFCVVILCNTAIGIFQEIRSKLTVEKLSLVNQPNVDVVRDGVQQSIPTQKVVLDDLIYFDSGKQICCDAQVVDGEVEVNESLLTGESDNVKKKAGDKLYSGSFVVSGNCYAVATAVGINSYAEQLTSKVKKFKKPNSQLMKSINQIIMAIAVVIFPLGIATLLKGHFVGGLDWREATLKACGSMIGMVPSGMVLLTSIALAVSVIKLAQKKCLVQDLYCIEMLARVDTLCLDKTGTITDGTMTVEEVVTLDEAVDVGKCLSSLISATKDQNATATALKNKFGTSDVKADVVLPFSSKKKYSASTIDGVGTVVMGAGEFIFKNLDKDVEKLSRKYLEKGLRVITVAHSNSPIVGQTLPQDLKVCGLVVLSDTIRKDAPEIIQWFKENDVQVKIISGDNPLSVSVIARKVGVVNAEKYISLDGMTDEEVQAVANKYTVFGRVTPEQKALLVKALKAEGHTVAMTGDGVNDILAMRESDCAVSVASGSQAAKSCAHLLLLDNTFSSMPAVVREGRQVVNNIQSSSTLYLMKTTMTVLTTFMLLFTAFNYPFEAQHLYAFEFFINGVPAFFLALRPNANLIKGHFIKNVAKSALPNGFGVWLAVALTFLFSGVLGLTQNQISTVAMVSMTITGVGALVLICIPFDRLNVLAAGFSAIATPLALFVIFPWALGMIASEGATPYIVNLNLVQALATIGITVFCVLVIVLAKQLVKLLEKKGVLKI